MLEAMVLVLQVSIPMDGLKPIEMNVIDNITGMRSGYVLNFTNQTFRDFFATEVGVDIYDDAYARHGQSKGKRLKTFLEIGQKSAIVRALVALWQYSSEIEHKKWSTEEKAVVCRKLSAIVERLGGSPISCDLQTDKDFIKSDECCYDEAVLSDLERSFLDLHPMEPHSRGYAFERFLCNLFAAWRMDAREGFKVRGEQIDGSFQMKGATYLLEAKWHSRPSDASALRAFQGKVEDRPNWTRCLFVAYQGFTSECLYAFQARRVILMDGFDIYDSLRRRISLARVVAEKERYASERNDPFRRVKDLFPE